MIYAATLKQYQLTIAACLNDIRYDNKWFPLNDNESSQSPAADITTMRNTQPDCVRNDCTAGICPAPFICQSLWGNFVCV